MAEISPATHLIVKGARQHNLKNIDLTIPKNKLVVFTGVSGSGKSSMAHDTIYAEGQRRYVESLSSYARQFLGVMDKPDVDSIEGLSPAILIDQKQGSHNPRSTVGTVTEIYDYLRLLFARVGHPHCPKCSREVMAQDVTQIRDAIYNLAQSDPSMTKQKGVRLLIMAPVIKNKRGEFKELLINLAKKGIGQVRVDGKFIATNSNLNLFKNNRHDIDAIIDKIVVEKQGEGIDSQPTRNRLIESIETALKLSGGEVFASIVKDASLSFPEQPKDWQDHLYSENLACPVDNISLPKLEPRYFSFNSPDGACPTCTGLGSKLTLNRNLILAPSLTLLEGGIVPLAGQFETETWMARLITKVMAEAGFNNKTPLEEMTEKQKEVLFGGTGKENHAVHGLNSQGRPTIWHTPFAGLVAEFERRYQETSSNYVREELDQYMVKLPCPACRGDRLKPEVLGVTVNAKNIAAITAHSIDKALVYASGLTNSLNPTELQIATPILKEIKDRLEFLQSVGLSYLTINREAGSLSGGELQRIRLASQIGSRLTGILYVLDEPTIGLHQRDNQKLITTLKNLVSLGNTLVVVEHDRDTILSAGHLVEFGPSAGEKGGQLTFEGEISAMKKSLCLTGQYIANKKIIAPVKTLKKPKQNSEITLTGCTYHNLKNISVDIPLGKLIGVTGVSGSGKSSLIVDTLYEALARQLNRQHQRQEVPFSSVKFLDAVKRVSLIDQSPIGRTPRSNPATYTKVFDYVRSLFAGTKDAHLRSYGPGRFSFNVKGGRCETCQGEGQIKIEMQFMGDIYVTCQTCKATRFNQPTLEITYRGKNIAEILDLTIDQAADFFKGIPGVEKKLTTLKQVGLGYIRLGQPAPTLSGGEAQRVKLASELTKTGSGHTIYLLDEPTTGLHFDDVAKLMQTLVDLVENDNSVIVIEHNLDVIKNCDYLIDMGPEGGDNGGQIIAAGTPKEITEHFDTPTAQELKKVYFSHALSD